MNESIWVRHIQLNNLLETVVKITQFELSSLIDVITCDVLFIAGVVILFQKQPENISHFRSVSRKYEEEILKVFYFTSLLTRLAYCIHKRQNFGLICTYYFIL